MHDNHRKQSFWRTLMEFLSRDVRSFSKGLRPIKGNATTETTQAVSVPHLIDPKQLDRIKYRREILDWRDETIIKLGDTGKNSLYDFSKHTWRLLEEVSLFGRVFQKPANKALKAAFDSRIRLIIRGAAIQATNDLAQLFSKQGDNKPEMPLIKDYWPDGQLSCIEKNGFKLANHGKIISGITLLVNGNRGIVRMFQDQVINIAEQMIKKVSS